MHHLFAILFVLSPFHSQLEGQSGRPESWASQRISLSISDAPVNELVAHLHDNCVPLSFIESSVSRRISLSVHDTDVSSILKKVQAQAPEYLYEVIDGRPVLYPREEKFQALLQNGDVSMRPRLEAADKLAEHLRQTISGFDGLLVAPVVTLGGSHFPLHDTLVEQRKEGRVIEHLVDLLGSDLKLHLTFKTVRLNYYFLDLRHLDCNPQAESPPGCSWNGLLPAWILATHMPPMEIKGFLGPDIFLSLHQNGIPVSFISAAVPDSIIRLKTDSSMSVQQVLEEIIRLAPHYQYSVIQGTVLLYPKAGDFDKQVQVSQLSGVTRARALVHVLRELKAKAEGLGDLQMPVLRSFGRSMYGGIIEVGGSRSVTEHLVSLMGSQPSLAFRIWMKDDGHYSFVLDWVKLVTDVRLDAPSQVEPGAVLQIQVKGVLADGTTVSLEGSGCGVEYRATGALGLSELGQIVAQKSGTGTVVIQYEDLFAQADVEVN